MKVIAILNERRRNGTRPHSWIWNHFDYPRGRVVLFACKLDTQGTRQQPPQKTEGQGVMMTYINWYIELADKNFLLAAVLWILIGYVATYAVRYILHMPCRFDGDEEEQFNFKLFLVLWPLAPIVGLKSLLYEGKRFFRYKFPYLRNQRRLRNESKERARRAAEEKKPPDFLHIQ